MPATLEQLVKVRSQRAEEVMAYLRQLADRLDMTPWARRDGERIRASDVYVEPFVLTKERRTGFRRPAIEREERERSVETRSPMEEIEAPLYEVPVDLDDREERCWRQVVRRARVRLALKGAPGSGKTFITRYTVAAKAREAAAKFGAQEASLDQIEAPVWVTATSLAGARPKGLTQALLEAHENSLGFTLAPAVRDWLEQATGSLRLFLVVDALDELIGNDRPGFDARARQLDDLAGRVIVTCRTMHWEERRDWLCWRGVTEVELAPFKRRQQREFAREFFEENPESAQSMGRLVQANYGLRHACTTPLLLTFAGLLHQEGVVNEGTTYAQLYAHMTRRMVTGEWGTRGIRPPWAGSGVREEQCLRMLEDAGWGIFSAAPERNRFTLADWQVATTAALAECPLAPVGLTQLLEDLEGVGFVAPAGFDDTGRRCWSFAHRTFLEFLAARALSRRPTAEWLAEAKKHFWFQPEWLEVITFLAGLVQDATPLVRAVEVEQKHDDLFRSMLTLKARLVGRARHMQDQGLCRTAIQVLGLHEGTLLGWQDFLEEFALPMFGSLSGNAHARAIVLQTGLAWTRSKNRRVRAGAARALASMGAAEAVPRLLEMTGDSDPEVRCAAVVALGRLGAAEAVPGLLEITRRFYSEEIWRAAARALAELDAPEALLRLLEMTRHEGFEMRAGAANALGRLGVPEALPRLLEMTGDSKSEVRCAAAEALGGLGAAEALPRLLEMTEGDYWTRAAAAEALAEIDAAEGLPRLLKEATRNDWTLWSAVAEALGRLGTAGAVPRLLEIMWEGYQRNHAAQWYATKVLVGLGVPDAEATARLLGMADDDKWLVRRVAEALGRLGGRNAVPRLLEMTGDDDWLVRCAAAEALGRLGATDAVPRLIEMTGDDDWMVRGAAAEALGRLGATDAVPRLIEMAADDNFGGRMAAAEALVRLGTVEAVPRLLEMTRQDQRGARQRAARWLWRIAWKHKMKIVMPES